LVLEITHPPSRAKSRQWWKKRHPASSFYRDAHKLFVFVNLITPVFVPSIMNIFSYTIASIIEYFFVTENLDVKAYPYWWMSKYNNNNNNNNNLYSPPTK
jgi:hypothetical protein